MSELFFNRNRVLWDGGFGTMLARAGVLAGAPEELCLTRPDVVQSIHAAYAEAGAMAVTTNSLGCTRPKLLRHGLADRCAELSAKSVAIARKAVQGRSLVAVSVGSLGELFAPLGPMTFDAALTAFAEQISAAKDAGANLCIIETVTDIAEARAAAIAAKEAGLPFVISYTFEGARMLMGGTPQSAALAAWAVGAVATGLNCSGGPESMLGLLPSMLAASPLPALVQPNAGLPSVINGETVFPYTPADMLPAMKSILELGAWGIGGCCGTTPEHIAAFAELISGLDAPVSTWDGVQRISSMRAVATLEEAASGYQEIAADLDSLYDADTAAPALLVDLRPLPLASLQDFMAEAQQAVKTPLFFRCADDEQAKLALRLYHGRAAVDCPSVSAETLQFYGAIRLN